MCCADNPSSEPAARVRKPSTCQPDPLQWVQLQPHSRQTTGVFSNKYEAIACFTAGQCSTKTTSLHIASHTSDNLSVEPTVARTPTKCLLSQLKACQQKASAAMQTFACMPQCCPLSHVAQPVSIQVSPLHPTQTRCHILPKAIQTLLCGDGRCRCCKNMSIPAYTLVVGNCHQP